MPGPTKRKKYHQGITTEKKKYRTKRRKRDIDQIILQDLVPERKEQLENQVLDLDLPGGGQFYCVHCARHFIDKHSLDEHFRGKLHKRRVKDTEQIPYTIEESVKAAGQGSYLPPPIKRTKKEIDTNLKI